MPKFPTSHAYTMHRIDSGFVESPLMKNVDTDPQSIGRSRTAPNRPHKVGNSVADSKTSTCSMTSETRRPASERRPKPAQLPSATSSENSVTRSRGRAHGSKSSRRTSCTIVDPSRPARHYRIQSSQSVPNANSRDVDDVLALHFRSCSLFTNPSYHSHSGLPSPTLSQRDTPDATPRFSGDEMLAAAEMHSQKQDDETVTAPEHTNTTMHWTLPSTRQRDYERIDKANRGIRGFLRRVTPRCVSGPHEKFYEKDQSDAGSVRRYRLDNLNDEVDEKDALRNELNKMKRPNTQAGAPKKKWACF